MCNENLLTIYKKKLADLDKVGGNAYLALQEGVLQYIEEIRHQTNDQTLVNYCTNLRNTIDKINAFTNIASIEKIVQDMGEAYFFAIALDKGVCLTKIIETSMHQTPDFEITLKSGKKCYFEVKTPSLVNSQENLKEHQEQSLNARISIDAQLQAGNSVSFGETCMSPWECNNLLEMIDKGIAKIQQNIKPEQFTHTPTFLVVNWSLLQLYSNKRDGIIQPYFNNDGYIQSGEFWAMAFGNRGMPIIAFNGIEGHPTIIGNMEQFAILNRKKNSIVSGLIFLY